jgi:hypothetical protein
MERWKVYEVGLVVTLRICLGRVGGFADLLVLFEGRFPEGLTTLLKLLAEVPNSPPSLLAFSDGMPDCPCLLRFSEEVPDWIAESA